MKEPNNGDYWCWGLLTSDLAEAMTHGAKVAAEEGCPVQVSQYLDVNPCGVMPVTEVVATIKVHRS